MKNDRISRQIAYLLRHANDPSLHMAPDGGWVKTDELLSMLRSTYPTITKADLISIVELDQKQRFRFSADHQHICACQGHSIPGISPELIFKPTPDRLFHGTTAEKLNQIVHAGYLDAMARHSVHMTEDESVAWASARRRHNATPVVLILDAKAMVRDGIALGVSHNSVWCTRSKEVISTKYVVEILYRPSIEGVSTPTE